MKRILTISFALLIAIMSCTGQTGKTDKQAKGNLPKTSIKVNKRYDQNGNVIGYDSTYSSFYSKGDSTLKDDIFNKFEKEFNQKFSFGDERFFRKYFFDDSVFSRDFSDKNFFHDQFRDNIARMDSLFRRMDKMKNDFFEKQYQSDENHRK